MNYIDYQNRINKVTIILLERYISILSNDLETEEYEDADYIIDLCETVLSNIDIWSVDKTNRWLGFIQGTLIADNIINVRDERNFSRPLYHKAYKELDLNIPKTIEVKK